MFAGEGVFRMLLDSLQEGCYFVDPERAILFWNKAAERISGFRAEEVVGKRCFDNMLVHTDDEGNSLCHGVCPLASTIQDGEPRQTTVYLRHKEGHRVRVQVGVSRVVDEGGTVLGGLETFVDASPTLAALEEVKRLKELALLCPLTGVGNRRYAEQMLEARFDLLKRMEGEGTLAVLFLDIDNFKLFNDKYGHEVGDVVLKMVARTLRSAVRSSDFVGRWGGEEFVVVLSNLQPVDVARMAERLRALVQQSSRQSSQNRLEVTVSIGACQCGPADTGASLVRRADKLMYESKARGKNRVTMD